MENAQVAPKAPEIREDSPAEAQRAAVPMEVSPAVKQKFRQRELFTTSELYVDRPVAEGGYGSFAADGREFLETDAAIVRSLIRHYDVSKGRAYQMIAPIKLTICGTDEKPILMVLNGRQRTKAVAFINRIMEGVYELWQQIDGKSKVKLKNVLVTHADSARNGVQGVVCGNLQVSDLAMFDHEDIEHLVGGRVNNQPVQGFLTRSRDTEDGPMPYVLRAEFTDIDPNTTEALLLATAERIQVDTPPSVIAEQIQRLLDANLSPESVAANFGFHVKTLQNKLLVLHVHPEVRKAHDEGHLPLRALKELFFIEKKSRGITPKPEEEQLRLLAKVCNIEVKTKFEQKAVRDEIRNFPTGLKCACGADLDATNASRLPDGSIKHVGCAQAPFAFAASIPTAANVPGQLPAPSLTQPQAAGASIAPAPVSQPAPSVAQPGVAGSAPAGAPVTTAPKPLAQQTRKEKAEAPTTILAYLPKAAGFVRRAWECEPKPVLPPDVNIPTESIQQAAKLCRIEAAAAVLAYLGGDPTALGDMPEVQKIVIDALGEARSEAEAAEEKRIGDALQAKGQTLPQRVASSLMDLFVVWEDQDPDDRAPWPSVPEDAKDEVSVHVREAIGRIQADYAQKLSSGDATFKRDYESNPTDFARNWIIENFLA